MCVFRGACCPALIFAIVMSLAGIAMPAIVAVQALAHEAQSTAIEIRAEPTVHVEPAVAEFAPVTERAEAMTECDIAGSPSAFAEEAATTAVEPNETAAASEGRQADMDVLVLQIEASHYRNLDQTSLVFREDVVDLVTNHTGYQNGPFRLGWLRTPMSRDFELLRTRIGRYRALILSEETPTEPQFIPHARCCESARWRYRADIPASTSSRGSSARYGTLNGAVSIARCTRGRATRS